MRSRTGGHDVDTCAQPVNQPHTWVLALCIERAEHLSRDHSPHKLHLCAAIIAIEIERNDAIVAAHLQMRATAGTLAREHVPIQTRIMMYIYIYTYIHVYIYICICIYVCVCMYIYVYICIYIYIYTNIYIYMHLYMYAYI